jgi:hypothetical protein
MATPARGALRWARSASLTVAPVGLAASAHVLAGGRVPGWAALAVLALATSLVCVLVTGRRRGLAAIAVTMAGLQAGLHQGFMLLAPVRPIDRGCVGGLSAHAQHAAGALHGLCGPLAGHAHHELGTSPGMLLAHAGVTLLLSAALAGGERALWLLARLVAPAVLRSPLIPANRPAPLPSTAVVVPNAWTSVRCLTRRGPPPSASVVLG